MNTNHPARTRQLILSALLASQHPLRARDIVHRIQRRMVRPLTVQAARRHLNALWEFGLVNFIASPTGDRRGERWRAGQHIHPRDEYTAAFLTGGAP